MLQNTLKLLFLGCISSDHVILSAGGAASTNVKNIQELTAFRDYYSCKNGTYYILYLLL